MFLSVVVFFFVALKPTPNPSSRRVGRDLQREGNWIRDLHQDLPNLRNPRERLFFVVFVLFFTFIKFFFFVKLSASLWSLVLDFFRKQDAYATLFFEVMNFK